MSYLQTSYDALKRWEGVIPYLYLDSIGLVTIGVGFMLPNVFAASTLPFVNPAGEPSTQTEIASDFNRVKSLPSNKLPTYYHSFSSPLLPQAEINRLLAANVASFEISLRRMYPDYDAYPDSVKVGLIDMCYNLGAAKLQAQYPKFNRAVQTHNWILAADQCHRNGPSAERNEFTQKLFLEAV